MHLSKKFKLRRYRDERCLAFSSRDEESRTSPTASENPAIKNIVVQVFSKAKSKPMTLVHPRVQA
jgi:hypothetical protein